MKTCTVCLEPKALEEFHRSAKGLHGRTSQCIPCRLAKIRAKQAADPTGAHLEYRKTYWRANREALRVQRLMRTYGVTAEQLEAMREAQGDRCAICLQPETKIDHRYNTVCLLAVDHDHETGEVRGLLCDKCNRGIGLLQEDADNLRRAADYLGANVKGMKHSRQAATRGAR